MLSLCAGLVAGAMTLLTAQQVTVVETDGDQSKLLQSQPALTFSAGQGANAITVDSTTTFQTMDGFGAALTDSSAWLIANQLNASQQAAFMQQLFDPHAGIGLSFLRQPMGASDFSQSGNYSYDDMAAGQTDPQLTHFSVAHDQTYLIPLLKQALAINPMLKIIAEPWSPPAWMKTSGTMNGGKVNTAMFGPLASYFVKFVQAYNAAGIPIYAVAPQNEPENSNMSYPTALLSAPDEANFVANYLAPAFAGSGINTAIIGYEHNWNDTTYPTTLLAGSAAPYLLGTAFHCYAGSVASQSTVEAAYLNKGIWFTECSGTVGSSFSGDLVWNTSNLLIGATRNWARSVLLWNLVLNRNSGPQNGGCTNCRGVVTINGSTITPNVEYYVLAHLAKYVMPGAKRISSNTFGAGSIEDVAFLNPDRSIALLVLNEVATASTFQVNWQGQTFSYTLPASSIATFVWPSRPPSRRVHLM
jgi:glucosylceramidase